MAKLRNYLICGRKHRWTHHQCTQPAGHSTWHPGAGHCWRHDVLPFEALLESEKLIDFVNCITIYGTLFRGEKYYLAIAMQPKLSRRSKALRSKSRMWREWKECGRTHFKTVKKDDPLHDFLFTKMIIERRDGLYPVDVPWCYEKYVRTLFVLRGGKINGKSPRNMRVDRYNLAKIPPEIEQRIILWKRAHSRYKADTLNKLVDDEEILRERNKSTLNNRCYVKYETGGEIGDSIDDKVQSVGNSERVIPPTIPPIHAIPPVSNTTIPS